MEQISDISTFLGRFHPMLVHLPIGFITLALLFQLLSSRPSQSKLKPALPFIWFCGCISSFVSVILGLLLSSSGEYDSNIINWHKWSGFALTLATFVYYLISIIKSEWINVVYTDFLKPFLLFIIFAMLILSGHNGGSLTHGKGYLIEYAPRFIQNAISGPESKIERNKFELIDSADIFNDAILPIFQSKCISCHNQTKRKGQLILATYQDIIKGGKHGIDIVPGSSITSELYRRITLPAEDKEAMPGDGKKPLSDDQIAIIEWWIDRYAPQKGVIAELSPDSSMMKILERFFGVHDVNQRMPNVEPPDNLVIERLLQKGYSIRKISQGNYLLEIKAMDTIIHSEDLNQLNLIADNVIWLDLSDTKLTDEDLSVISKFKNLRKLNLSKNPVTDYGVRHLINLPQLEYLNLYETSVADSTAILLSQMLSLRELYLWNTNVTDTLLDQLISRKKPHLEIIYQ